MALLGPVTDIHDSLPAANCTNTRYKQLTMATSLPTFSTTKLAFTTQLHPQFKHRQKYHLFANHVDKGYTFRNHENDALMCVLRDCQGDSPFLDATRQREAMLSVWSTLLRRAWRAKGRW